MKVSPIRQMMVNLSKVQSKGTDYLVTFWLRRLDPEYGLFELFRAGGIWECRDTMWNEFNPDQVGGSMFFKMGPWPTYAIFTGTISHLTRWLDAHLTVVRKGLPVP